MATKKKPTYKKAPARKKAVVENDPPIIVSGGGGPEPKKARPAGPFINVSFTPEGAGSGKLKAKVDKTKTITGATISFNQKGVDPVKLSGDGPFEITIQFTTG